MSPEQAVLPSSHRCRLPSTAHLKKKEYFTKVVTMSTVLEKQSLKQ